MDTANRLHIPVANTEKACKRRIRRCLVCPEPIGASRTNYAICKQYARKRGIRAYAAHTSVCACHIQRYARARGASARPIGGRPLAGVATGCHTDPQVSRPGAISSPNCPYKPTCAKNVTVTYRFNGC